MPPIVSFIGWHNSGKTTFASQVVAHLQNKGYRVAAMKSSAHLGASFDRPDTDTDKHRQAGADPVALRVMGGVLTLRNNEADYISVEI